MAKIQELSKLGPGVPVRMRTGLVVGSEIQWEAWREGKVLDMGGRGSDISKLTFSGSDVDWDPRYHYVGGGKFRSGDCCLQLDLGATDMPTVAEEAAARAELPKPGPEVDETVAEPRPVPVPNLEAQIQADEIYVAAVQRQGRIPSLREYQEVTVYREILVGSVSIEIKKAWNPHDGMYEKATVTVNPGMVMHHEGKHTFGFYGDDWSKELADLVTALGHVEAVVKELDAKFPSGKPMGGGIRKVPLA